MTWADLRVFSLLLLLARLCWFLVATGMLKQEGADQIAHTARSRAYASVNPLSAMLQIG
jgi:hypothetical protein